MAESYRWNFKLIIKIRLITPQPEMVKWIAFGLWLGLEEKEVILASASIIEVGWSTIGDLIQL